MKVTVTSFLNVRVGMPRLTAPAFHQLSPKTEIEIDGKLYRGDKYEGIDTWVRDSAGNYYWSGGTNYSTLNASVMEVSNPPITKFNYNDLIRIKPRYKATKGKGVTVAVIDTGCGKHSALGDAVKSEYSVFTKAYKAPDNSLNGHGTFLCGIIGARENHENEIIGIAPECQLSVVKAVEEEDVDGSNVLDALRWIDNQALVPDIINLSLDFDPATNIDNLTTLFNSLTQKGAIIVAAGQNETLIYSNSIFYPARDVNVHGVGAISEDKISTNPVNPAINYILPNWDFYSLGNYGDLYKSLKGCSISSAILTASLALICSYRKSNPVTQNPVAVLNGEAVELLTSNFDNTLKIFRP